MNTAHLSADFFQLHSICSSNKDWVLPFKQCLNLSHSCRYEGYEIGVWHPVSLISLGGYLLTLKYSSGSADQVPLDVYLKCGESDLDKKKNHLGEMHGKFKVEFLFCMFLSSLKYTVFLGYVQQCKCAYKFGAFHNSHPHSVDF